MTDLVTILTIGYRSIRRLIRSLLKGGYMLPTNNGLPVHGGRHETMVNFF
jgi:hypothetical protein